MLILYTRLIAFYDSFFKIPPYFSLAVNIVYGIFTPP